MTSPCQSRGDDTKPSLSPFPAILKCFFIEIILKILQKKFADLLATMQCSDSYLNVIHLKHTNYFFCRTPRGELCAQLSSLREILDV